ncbi:MAG: UdgX family uracil-DNA binding protein, partial [Pseudomonadota bacterium]
LPRKLHEAPREVVCHRDEARFVLLYDLLFRLQSDRHLLRKAADPLLDRMVRLAKEIRRDAHKMKAFVRFQKVGERTTVTGDTREQFVSWFEPSHRIVRFKASFFVKRFTSMDWSILTPDDCVHWDGEKLRFTPGTAKPAAREDALEDAWRTYYASIFNPARLKVSAMQSEMPKKYWKNLPEAELIPELVRSAQSKMASMVDAAPTLPKPAMMRHREIAPEEPALDLGKVSSLSELRTALGGCRACPLHGPATQVVPGTGQSSASLMIVGEQPGDQEDLAGRPFVGPAGAVLHALIDEAGLDRDDIFLTNAVKHFKYQPRGKRRIHQNPAAHEIDTCRWWLEKEIALVQPKLIVGLGGSAMRGLTGRTMAIGRARGEEIAHASGTPVIATYHPSYVLRAPEPEAPRRMLLEDLQRAHALLAA